jgi:hypothetical protein
MQMQKKVIVGCIEDLIINALNTLEDEACQRRVWFRAEGAEVSSYIDITTHFLSRCESIFKDPQTRTILGEETYDQLKKLYDLILVHVDLTEDRIDVDDLQEEELLNDPNWHDIQMLAGKVKLKLTDFLKREGHV